jgi:hypothetical protein
MQYPSQLIDGKEIGLPGQPGNPWRQPVDHPTVFYVSWFEEPYDIGSVEAAFFDHEGKWHNYTVLGFEEYEDGCEGAGVYRHIPREFLIDWMRIYAPYKPPASR